MNDFGGKSEHIMTHRYFNNRDRNYHIDWEYWAKRVKKDEVWNGLKEYTLDKQPDLLFVEEMLIVRKTLEEAEMNLAERVLQYKESEITKELITTIEACDIPGMAARKRATKGIRFAS